jgi:hypothetical protein
LLLVIPVLLVILFLVSGAFSIGKARIWNAYNAENDVYGQVVAGRDFSAATDARPPVGIGVVKPELPNWYAEANTSTVATIQGTKGMPGVEMDGKTIRYADKAIMLDPSWHMPGVPQTDTGGMMQDWFKEYVYEAYGTGVNPQEMRTALGMADPGPP